MPKAMGSGDLDGDGIDEIFVAYLANISGPTDKELAFNVIKKNGEGYSEIASTEHMNQIHLGDDISVQYIY